jgi:hypothetical protein
MKRIMPIYEGKWEIIIIIIIINSSEDVAIFDNLRIQRAVIDVHPKAAVRYCADLTKVRGVSRM